MVCKNAEVWVERNTTVNHVGAAALILQNTSFSRVRILKAEIPQYSGRLTAPTESRDHAFGATVPATPSLFV